ncbi:kinase-like domain-containing protein [Aspergillus undulatus]|uniref:kinase-like domain-containing protein n=1 Tax=Aspergillus undulatus TaxID=1810928 RepID=UPI003CCDA151
MADHPSKGTLRSFQSELKAQAVQSASAKNSVFIPNSVIQQLVDDNVRDILREENIMEPGRIPIFVKTIRERAPKLFAMLVHLEKEQHIVNFLEEDIFDECLPFQTSEVALFTKQGNPIQTSKDWTAQSREDLWLRQYQFLSPTFCKGTHYDFDEHQILPFLDRNTALDYISPATGDFGIVTRAWIHPDHHKFKSLPGSEALVVAVKRIHRKDDFVTEGDVYRELGSASHAHLIELLFSYEKETCFYLIFPWADGNLREYWDMHPDPELSSGLVRWTLAQMAGIADGLAFFHQFTNPEWQVTLYGRHGNVKADSILWFRDSQILKLASLGFASIHDGGSIDDADHDTVLDIVTYGAPEIQREQKVSRKWDIWGLGCLYLEILTYLILGSGDAVSEFSTRRRESNNEYPDLKSDSFYSNDFESVKPSVGLWVTKLKESLRCTEAMHDILDLVMTRMIVIEPKDRGSARDIYEALSEILDRAVRYEMYLLRPKFNIHTIPDPGGRPGQDNTSLEKAF